MKGHSKKEKGRIEEIEPEAFTNDLLRCGRRRSLEQIQFLRGVGE
jgi:hypothetical protein